MSYVLDTSVLAEYIIAKSPHRDTVAKLFRDCGEGVVKLYVTPITLSELIYVATRVYELAKTEDPNRESLNYVFFLREGVGVRVVPPDDGVAVRAGELKKELRLPLADCYVLAAAEKLRANPLFKRVESEMKPVERRLRKLGLVTLNEVSQRGP